MTDPNTEWRVICVAAVILALLLCRLRPGVAQERDPRDRPRPGDVLSWKGVVRTVVDYRGGTVSFQVADVEFDESMMRWHEWSRYATVIKRGAVR
jgi:hypothetical protein